MSGLLDGFLSNPYLHHFAHPVGAVVHRLTSVLSSMAYFGKCVSEKPGQRTPLAIVPTRCVISTIMPGKDLEERGNVNSDIFQKSEIVHMV